MPSKSKSKHRSVSSTPTPAQAANSAPVAARPAATAAKTIGKSFSTEFNPDYTFVKQDLKRIAIVAGSFFVILVILSFFLR